MPNHCKYRMPDGTSVQQYCKEHHLSADKIRGRIKAGMTPAEAVKVQKIIWTKANVKYFAPNKKSIYRYCKDNNLPYQSIQNRMAQGMTFEEALQNYASSNRKYRGTKNEFINYKGEYIKVKDLLIRELGYYDKEYHRYMRNGFELKQALLMFISMRKRKQKK